ncbi:MAG: thioredoxin [Alistipes sp.]|nr:thioredoxin [Alistipes sp.]
MAIFAVVAAPTLSAATPESSTSPVIKVTNSNYNELIAKHQLLVVDFWASWCGPCRAIAPIIEELAQEYKGKVAIGKCNVDENRSLTNSFGVQGIPAIYIIKNGKVVDEQIGYCNKDTLKAKIEKWR